MVEVVVGLLNSNLFHWFFLVGAVLLFLAGAAMLYGIVTKGKVLLIGALLKNKHYDNEILKARYLIQAIYTMGFGAALMAVTFLEIATGVTIFCGMLVIGILDGLYDYFAIKSALKGKNETRETEPRQ